ncbi:MAG: 2Fe-2S iron-sulfur cluster binding domain-containing protein [Planctomycetota bacterium]|nr:2Fe-2S iron-sulfur cluster binding domain-containing protein [Planctomycetota bacterium]MDA1138243.1 2Fe-2S iron-sulfur cluster binding domain-containing protein [Planctomycetota bacterium]
MDKTAYKIHVPELDKTFTAAANEFILDAAFKHDIELPFGCRMGMCRACMVKVRGEAVHQFEPVLSKDEIANGYHLICCSQPRSDLVLDYEVE